MFVCGSFWNGEVRAAPIASSTQGFPDIQLEDQFRTAHTPDSLFSGVNSALPLVLIAGDQRRTDENIRVWVNLLKGSLGNRVQDVGLTNLRGLPFFVSKNSVRSSLKKKLPDVAVLCDWNGEGFKQFACVRKQMNIHVYSAARKLIGSFTGTPVDERVKAVAALVEVASVSTNAASLTSGWAK